MSQLENPFENPFFVTMMFVTILALFYLLGRLAYVQWTLKFRRFFPDELGRDEFERAAKFKETSWRDKVEKNGITFSDWLKALEENASLLKDEISRRGIARETLEESISSDTTKDDSSAQ